jgi:hypothetical protein
MCRQDPTISGLGDRVVGNEVALQHEGDIICAGLANCCLRLAQGLARDVRCYGALGQTNLQDSAAAAGRAAIGG